MYVLTHNFKTNMDKIAFLSTKPKTKGARAALFFVAERVGSHTCAFLNAQGAQVCEANLMSRTKAVV